MFRNQAWAKLKFWPSALYGVEIFFLHTVPVLLHSGFIFSIQGKKMG
jgi:uncharacterized membrane protein YagU involved in acid resistance